MTVTTRTVDSIGSAGSWTASAGDLAASIQLLDGEYAISPAVSNNMYFTSQSFGSTVSGQPIQQVNIRLRARTSATGQSTGSLTVGYWRLGLPAPIMYNTNPGSGYTPIANDGQWAWYEFPYLQNPETGAAWQESELPGAGWGRIYVRYFADGAPVHVDMVEIAITHSVPTLNSASGLYRGPTIVTRAYLGDALVWGPAPGP